MKIEFFLSVLFIIDSFFIGYLNFDINLFISLLIIYIMSIVEVNFLKIGYGLFRKWLS